VYALLISVFTLIADYPILGIAAGALSGMMFNFLLSRHVVFWDRIKTSNAPVSLHADQWLARQHRYA
jgi:putative flippase GtrA